MFAKACDGASGQDLDFCITALAQEHFNDLPRTLTAKQLPELLLVKVYLVFFYKIDELPRRKSRQGGFREMRIFRDKILARTVDVRKVASPAARDDDLSADLGVVFEDQIGRAHV